MHRLLLCECVPFYVALISVYVLLCACLKDKKSLLKELSEAKNRSLSVVKDYPNLYSKMQIVLNSTAQSPSAAQQQVNPSEGRGGVVRARGVGDDLLSDDVMETLARDLRKSYMPVPTMCILHTTEFRGGGGE